MAKRLESFPKGIMPFWRHHVGTFLILARITRSTTLEVRKEKTIRKYSQIA